jgi:CheY-like chemotaxis protein
MLEGSGHMVRAAEDGNGGIESFTMTRPDLVITDMIMPQPDGIETIRALRDVDPSVPIIAISGGSGSVLMVARNAGAVAALAKPFEATHLLEAVADATRA